MFKKVDSDGIYIRYIPFHFNFRKIEFAELRRAQARKYRPILEYGGWGIRGAGFNRAYNVSGSHGVQVIICFLYRYETPGPKATFGVSLFSHSLSGLGGELNCLYGLRVFRYPTQTPV
jgi:hypothetical protein